MFKQSFLAAMLCLLGALPKRSERLLWDRWQACHVGATDFLWAWNPSHGNRGHTWAIIAWCTKPRTSLLSARPARTVNNILSACLCVLSVVFSHLSESATAAAAIRAAAILSESMPALTAKLDSPALPQIISRLSVPID